MPDSTSAEDTVIRIAALKAARDAADHMVKSSAQKNANSIGAFALYTWGSLAFISAVFATVIGVSPGNFLPQPVTLAENKPALKNTIAMTVPQPAPVVEETVELPQKVAAEIERPVLPVVKPPKVKVVKTKQDLKLDMRSTGSVTAPSDAPLQPFPDDPLPEILFAVDIGGAKSATPLIIRYAALKRRAPDLFGELEARIQIKGRGQSLETRLIAGPFSTQNEVAHFCRALRLRLTIDCQMSTFEGEAFQ